jgi:quercetin dioxygenase-like cupin family protein
VYYNFYNQLSQNVLPTFIPRNNAMIKKNIYTIPPAAIDGEHNGKGLIYFRSVLESEFQSKIAFLHYTILPPGSIIGYHQHLDSEEVYLILKGQGIMEVDSQKEEVFPGDVILTQKGSSHGLANHSNDALEILVFEGKF